MVTVFGSFVLGDSTTIKLFGVGLATAILIDTTVVRMVLVPATMELLGDRNWWFPRCSTGSFPVCTWRRRRTSTKSWPGSPSRARLSDRSSRDRNACVRPHGSDRAEPRSTSRTADRSLRHGGAVLSEHFAVVVDPGSGFKLELSASADGEVHLRHLGFRADDVDAARANLVATGMKTAQAPQRNDFAKMYTSFLAQPGCVEVQLVKSGLIFADAQGSRSAHSRAASDASMRSPSPADPTPTTGAFSWATSSS